MHFSLTIIGALMASRRLVLFFVAPLFTSLCDRTWRHREFLTLTSVAYYASSALLAYLHSLPAVALVIILREAFVSGCEPVINNTVIATIRDPRYESKKAAFGDLRLYGSLGWGLSSALGPFLIDTFFNGNLLFLFHFQAIIGISVVALVMYFVDMSPDLFRRQAARQEEKQIETSNTECNNRTMWSVLSPTVIYVIVVAVLQGVVFGALQTTGFIYLSAIPISVSWLGMSVSFSCASEALFFSFDRSLTDMLGGTRRAYVISSFGNTLCLFLYTMMQFVPMAGVAFIFVEMFCGAMHALFLSTSLQVAADLAPPNYSTMAQGMLSGLFYGLGPAIGAFVSGTSYERFGAPTTYMTLFAINSIVIFVPLVFGVDYMTKIKKGVSGEGYERIRDTTECA